MLAQRSATPLLQHVLVVDDQPDICTVVQTGLEMLGHNRVTLTRSCDNALPLLDSDRADPVSVDVVLPGMTAIELAARTVGRSIPVLLVTKFLEEILDLAMVGFEQCDGVGIAGHLSLLHGYSP